MLAEDRMARRIVFAALSVATLVGCVSPAELRKEDEAACMSFGFKPGTNEFASCLQRESLARRYGSAWYGGGGVGWYGPGLYGAPLYPM